MAHERTMYALPLSMATEVAAAQASMASTRDQPEVSESAAASAICLQI